MMQAETIAGMPGRITAEHPGPQRPMSDSGRDRAAALDDSLGRRLRAVRERRRISIATIAESTKILGALLEGLENDDVSRWPTGLYRRAFIRAYATAIGLDPEPIVREFLARFPEPDDVAPMPAAPAAAAAPRAVLRLTLAEPIGLSGATIGQIVGRRLLAMAADTIALALLGGFLFAFLGAFWAPLALAVAFYFLSSVLLLGTTPGVCLAMSIAPHGPRAASVGHTQPGLALLRTWGRRLRALVHARSRV
jgi:hypothetical protein